jgi:hypothetical protein
MMVQRIQKVSCNFKSLDRLLSLFCEFPIRESCCDDFVKMICKWSSTLEFPMGDPVLHHSFGIKYYQGIVKSFFDFRSFELRG